MTLTKHISSLWPTSGTKHYKTSLDIAKIITIINRCRTKLDWYFNQFLWTKRHEPTSWGMHFSCSETVVYSRFVFVRRLWSIAEVCVNKLQFWFDHSLNNRSHLRTIIEFIFYYTSCLFDSSYIGDQALHNGARHCKNITIITQRRTKSDWGFNPFLWLHTEMHLRGLIWNCLLPSSGTRILEW